MSVIITDLGNDIQFTFSGGDVYTLNKLSLKAKQANEGGVEYVYFTNGDGFIQTADSKVIRLRYTDVSSPSYSSNTELFEGVLGMVSGVSLGGSSGASGDGVYSSGSKSFTATPGVGTANITVTGYPYTFDNTQVLSASKYNSGVKESLNTSQVTVSGGVITFVGEDNFVSGDTVKVYLEGPYRAYDQAGDQDLVFVTNQDSEKWTSVEKLIDLSAEAADTWYYVIPMEGFKDISLHWKLTGGGAVTMTLWATNNADADDSAVTNWVDVTGDELTKTLTVSAGSVEFIEMVRDLGYLKLMVRIVSTGTANSADLYIKKKAL